MQVQAQLSMTSPLPRIRSRVDAVRRRTFAAADAPLVLPARVPIGRVSRADGEWRVNWRRAHADARRALAKIDFSKPDILLWVPGTDERGISPDVRLATSYLYGARPRSLSSIDYVATWHLRDSMPTGLATFKLVMEGVRQRFDQLEAAGKTRPRLLVGGLSQGAWILGEAMADPRVQSLVTRAALVGHPWLAHTQYEDGAHPRVRRFNNRGDQVAMPVAGSTRDGMDAMIAVRTGTITSALPAVARALLANPIHGVLLLHTELRNNLSFRPYLRDPHDYRPDLPRIFSYLVDGRRDESLQELDERLHRAARR